MADDAYDEVSRPLAMGLFATVAVLIGVDLAVDWHAGVGLQHLSIELVVLLLCAAGILVLWQRLRAVHSDLSDARAQAGRWRSENEALLRGLGAAIQAQFERWKLSAAEAEVALLLLKGLSHKEIAALRGASERTIREQARAVYRKAELSGRAALSAFFLEDLLLPGR